MNSARTPEKLGRVPNQPRPSNPHRSVRFEDIDWEDGDAVAREMGTSRGAVLNQFLRWYLRRPGAKLPTRPAAELTDKVEQDRLDREAQD